MNQLLIVTIDTSKQSVFFSLFHTVKESYVYDGIDPHKMLPLTRKNDLKVI